MCGNIEGNVNCTYTFVAGRSTSKLYCKTSEQNKTAKAKKYQRDDISKQLSRAFAILKSEVALSWLENNEMIANPEKFHAILLRKNQTNTSGEPININGKMIKSEETVKLLGVTLDYRLDFDPHISNICKKAATQLNVFKRLKAFIGFREKQILVQSFVYSNFNY